jgi:hypothetical protein
VFTEEGMEVSAGAIVDEEACVVRHVEMGVESGEERVVEDRKNVRFHLDVGQFF